MTGDVVKNRAKHPGGNADNQNRRSTRMRIIRASQCVSDDARDER